MREVSSLLHQRIVIWRQDEIIENIEVDQSYYMAEVNHVDRRNFNMNLANIEPCNSEGDIYSPMKSALYFLSLRENGFQWDQEIMEEENDEEGVQELRLTGWGMRKRIMFESTFFENI